MDAAQHIVKLKPIAVELVDRVTHPVFRVAHRDPSRVQGVYQMQRSAADVGTTLSSVAGDEPSAYLALDRAVLESVPGAVQNLLDGVGARSYVGVPLRAPDERLLGHLAMELLKDLGKFETACKGTEIIGKFAQVGDLVENANVQSSDVKVGTIKKIELDDNEKLVTIRAAVARQIKASGSAVNLGVRNGAIYLSRGPIPGGATLLFKIELLAIPSQ